MKTIFFINNAKKGVNEPNSIVLRFYLKSLKKYKVKGLSITCTKKDWNQEDQKVKRSNQFYQKFNNRLNFIENELTKIEEKREVKEEDINKIVTASIKNVQVQDVVNESENLKMLMINKHKSVKASNSSDGTILNYKSFISKLEKFEAYNGAIITLEDLINNSELIQEKLLNWCRNVEKNKDNSIGGFFDKLNASINYYNKINKKNIPVFTQRDNNYKHDKKEIIYLTREELSNLYKFVYAPTEKMQEIPRPNSKEIKYLKYFLLRCFVGCRIIEMNSNNFNPKRLNPYTKDLEAKSVLVKKDFNFSYFATKNNKVVTVPYIGSYLYDIASDLNWEFPDLSVNSDYVVYVRDEGKVVGEALKKIYGRNIRKIETIVNGKYIYQELSSCITTHTARKTFAYIIYNVNKDILQVKNCLGHYSIEVTMKYMGIEYDNKSIESFRLDM